MNNALMLNKDLAALVEWLRTPSGSIWTWKRQDDRHISVSLIDETKMVRAKNMQAIGLAGGEGRAIHFTNINSVWMESGGSYWIG